MQFKEKVPGGQETAQKVGVELLKQSGYKCYFVKWKWSHCRWCWSLQRGRVCWSALKPARHSGDVVRMLIEFICQRMRAKCANIRTTENILSEQAFAIKCFRLKEKELGLVIIVSKCKCKTVSKPQRREQWLYNICVQWRSWARVISLRGLVQPLSGVLLASGMCQLFAPLLI